MVNRILNYTLSSLTAFMLLAPSAHAYDECCDLQTNCCDYECPDLFSGLEAGIEILLWRPCVTNIDYGLLTNTTPSFADGSFVVGDYKSKQCYGYEPGGRLFLKKRDPCSSEWIYGASYTYIHPTNSQGFSNVLGGRVYSTLPHAALATANPVSVRFNSKFQYHNWDLLINRECNLGPCQTFTPYFGGEALYVIHRINSESLDTDSLYDNVVQWRGEYWGLGLKLGADYAFSLCDCLDLYTGFSGRMVAGQSTTRNYQYADDGGIVTWIFKTKGECLCVPGWHYKVGFRYHDCICGTMLKLWLGYEFIQWLGLPNPQRFYGQTAQAGYTAGQSTSQTGSNLGFHGLQFGASLGF